MFTHLGCDACVQFDVLLTYLFTYLPYCAVGLTPVQTLELNGLSNKLRDLEKRFEQLVASRKQEDGKQFQLVELQRQVELIHTVPHSSSRSTFQALGGVDPEQGDEAQPDIPRRATSTVIGGKQGPAADVT